MSVNIMSSIFMFNSLLMGLVGLLINILEPYLPIIIRRTYRYGKFSEKASSSIVAKMEVPKKWFRHFYLFAAPVSFSFLCLVFYRYFCNENVPEILLLLLDTLFGASRKPLVSAEDVILAMLICTIHCWKRAYEACYITVFSDQKMNLSHYFVGFVHYTGVFLCIIGESEGFVRDLPKNVSLHKLTVLKIGYALVFLWSSYIQLRTNVILANLRKNEQGNVVSYDHKIPHDELFKYISSPLQLTEIIVYIMLSAILWQASTFHYITLWVIINQIETGFLSHKWYHKTFKNYPKERKVLIPFIW